MTIVAHERTRCGRPLSLDADTRGDIASRRNVLFGLWAGQQLGLPPHEREPYAWSVHFADFDEPSDEDVIAKVKSDFAKAGVAIPERIVRHQLREMALKAYLQLSAERAPRRPARPKPWPSVRRVKAAG